MTALNQLKQTNQKYKSYLYIKNISFFSLKAKRGGIKEPHSVLGPLDYVNSCDLERISSPTGKSGFLAPTWKCVQL